MLLKNIIAVLFIFSFCSQYGYSQKYSPLTEITPREKIVEEQIIREINEYRYGKNIPTLQRVSNSNSFLRKSTYEIHTKYNEEDTDVRFQERVDEIARIQKEGGVPISLYGDKFFKNIVSSYFLVSNFIRIFMFNPNKEILFLENRDFNAIDVSIIIKKDTTYVGILMMKKK